VKIRASRSWRDGATWLRAVVAPFILGLVPPMAVCVIASKAAAIHPATHETDFGAAGGPFTIAFLFILVVAGALAGAVRGRDDAPVGFVSAMAGLGGFVLWAGYAPTGLDVDSFAIFGTVLACLAIPLAIGWAVYGVIRVAAGPRRRAVPSRAMERSGLMCGRCGKDVPPHWRGWSCPRCGALLSAFPPVKPEAPPAASDAPRMIRPV